MADFQKRPSSSDCCKDCGKDECECKGKRGPRGHDGHEGPVGPTGPSGSSGSGSTGATGATGTTGATGSAGTIGLGAYGYAVGTSTTVIGSNADVVFSLGATPFPNVGFTSVPAPAGTAFVVATTGDYEYDYYVAGVPSTGTSLEFALTVNGAFAIAGGGHEYRSNFSATGGDILVVRGEGIIHLTAGDVVTLRNRTLSGVDTVNVTNVPPGGEAGANVSLTLKKLN